jgi:hypothetical protein
MALVEAINKRGDELERDKGAEVEERRCFGLTLIYLVIF